MSGEFKQVETIKKILGDYHTIAVVGLSDKPDRPSYFVASYLQNQGYRIIPVNPRLTEVLGEKAYPDLASVPFEIDIVDIFRKSEDIPPIVDAAIEVGAKAIWMQEGVISEKSAQKAMNEGLDVVMDLCMLKEHRKHVV
ncbi:MAG: CoA-binding protein [candidate division Zixibacteria bacterium]